LIRQNIELADGLKNVVDKIGIHRESEVENGEINYNLEVVDESP